MPPQRRGLGHGLEALVPAAGRLQDAPVPASLPASAAPPLPRWEYACLERCPRRRRHTRIWFSTTDTSRVVRPRPAIVARCSLWAAAGILGDEGWELVGLDGRRFWFKRPCLAAALPPPQANGASPT